jgi:hypothetical protein
MQDMRGPFFMGPQIIPKYENMTHFSMSPHCYPYYPITIPISIETYGDLGIPRLCIWRPAQSGSRLGRAEMGEAPMCVYIKFIKYICISNIYIPKHILYLIYIYTLI